jgi:hypothetical protein
MEEDDQAAREKIVTQSEELYKEARGAVEALMSFLTSLRAGSICVTYFDEAHELGIRFWILLRLLSHQDPTMAMWYIFMGTKSNISYFSPSAQNCESAVLFGLRVHLLPKNNSAFFATQ